MKTAIEISPLRRIGAHYAALRSAQAKELASTGDSPFSGQEPADEAEARRVRRMAERLEAMPRKTRGEMLHLLGWKARAVPWSTIHHTWLTPILAAMPVRWRQWAIATIPHEVLAKAGGAWSDPLIGIAPGRPPVWWIAWFAGHVRRTLGFPEVAPWDQTGKDPLRRLRDLDDAALERTLRAHGLIGLAVCIRKLPRAEAQQLLWSVPTDRSAAVVEAVQSSQWVDDPFWPAIHAELAPMQREIDDRLVWMGLADVLRAGVQGGATTQLRLLAFRLPRTLGSWALAQLDLPPEWLALSVKPSVDDWKTRFAVLT